MLDEDDLSFPLIIFRLHPLPYSQIKIRGKMRSESWGKKTTFQLNFHLSNLWKDVQMGMWWKTTMLFVSDARIYRPSFRKNKPETLVYTH